MQHDEALRASVRDLARAEIAPYAADVDASGYFPLEGYDALRAAGLHAPYLPPQVGGRAFGESAVCAVVEELAGACASTSLIPAVNLVGAAPLLLAGTAAQERRYLAPVAAGEAMITAAMFDGPVSDGPVSDRAVSDATATGNADGAGIATAVLCRAERTADGWVLRGVKPRVPGAGVAHYYTVLAVTDPGADPEHALSVFVVEDSDAGLGLGERVRTSGTTGIPARGLRFDDVVLGADRLVGAVGDGLRIARRTQEYGRLVIAAHALGLAQTALDCVAALPAGGLAEEHALVADARHAVYQAAAAMENAALDASEAAARAKQNSCTAATRVTGAALTAALAASQDGPTACSTAARALTNRLARDARAVAWPSVAELERQGTDLAA